LKILKAKKIVKKIIFSATGGGVMRGGKNIYLSCWSKSRQSKNRKLLILYFYTMDMGFKENC